MVEQRANDMEIVNRHSCDMAKRTIMNQHRVPQLYFGRQPKRPHYVRDWMEKRNFRTDAEFAAEIGADKSLVSRWLDEDDPSTPGKEWQLKLGVFFGDEENPVDIFRHPDEDWMARKLRGKTPDEIRRIKQTLDLMFPEEKQASGQRK